jgi:hypothetical protein
LTPGTQRWIKTDGAFAQALVGRAEQIINGHRPAASKAVRLLMG